MGDDDEADQRARDEQARRSKVMAQRLPKWGSALDDDEEQPDEPGVE